MSQPLPQKDFQWCDKWSIETDMDKVSESIMQIDPESDTGYFFEVNPHYFVLFIYFFFGRLMWSIQIVYTINIAIIHYFQKIEK